MSRDDWPEVVLGDQCARITVGHVGPMADRYVGSGVPFLRSQDITPFRIVTEGVKFIDNEFNAQLRKSRLRAGDVAIVRTGYPGTAAVVPQELDGANCADLVVLTPGPQLDPWFIAGLFNSAWGKGQVGGVLVGVAQQHFNVGAAKAMKVRLPPLPQQEAAGSIIKAYTDLIDANQRRIAILEEMARRLFNEWFVHPDHSGNEMVPDGVADSSRTRLADWAVEVRDSVLPSQLEPTSRYVGLEHLPRRSTTLVEFGRADSVTSTKLRFRAGDVLFGKIRPYFHKVSYASCEGVTSSDSIVIRSIEARNGPFILAVTSSDDFVANAVATSNGTKMPRADWKILKQYEFLRPTTEALERFNAQGDANARLCASLAEQNVRLRMARDLLLPKLISGEIDVTAVEEMEAA